MNQPTPTLNGPTLRTLLLFPLLVWLGCILIPSSQASPIPTGFTYQGSLEDASGPINGTYSLRFRLYNGATGGSLVGPTLTNEAVTVVNGLFTTSVDFGNVFDEARWLQIAVRTNGSAGAFEVLSPRQAIQPAPYSVVASQLAGVLPSSFLSGLYTSEVQFNNLSNQFLGAFSGDGSQLDDLNADQITSGTLAEERLSSNVALTDRSPQSFAGTNQFRLIQVLDGSSTKRVEIVAVNSTGGRVVIDGPSSENVVLSGVSGAADRGNIQLSDGSGTVTAVLRSGSTGGEIKLANPSANDRVKLDVTGEDAGRTVHYGANGSVNVYAGHATGNADGGYVGVFDAAGDEKVFLNATGDAEGTIFTRGSNGLVTVAIGSVTGLPDNGYVGVRDSSGAEKAFLLVDNTDVGTLNTLGANGAGNVSLGHASGLPDNGYVGVRDSGGNDRGYLFVNGNGAGVMQLLGPNGQANISFTHPAGYPDNGYMGLRDSTGTIRANTWVDSNMAGWTHLYGPSGQLNVQLGNLTGYPDNGYAGVRNSSGVEKAGMYVNSSGEGEVFCDVLTINGGSDIAEPFDVREEPTATSDGQAAEPGAVVCIDPATPGQLILSRGAYDRTVAGIISGAGGIRTGMTLQQSGTVADGQHPVALTGRVWCKVDADAGAVRPGDLLTTSDTPGHAMRVQDHDLAQGAVLGKAMSSLETGRGLVLVLVSLQ